MHYRLLAAVLLLPALALGGCVRPTDPASTGPADLPPAATPWLISGAPSAPSPTASSPTGLAAPVTEGTTGGTFLPFPDGTRAITYHPGVVPPGATARVAIARTGTGTTVRLTVSGLVPRRAYGAHLHTRPCTATPDDAGPHYQHVPDPRAAASPPSVDPSYANPRNEVWLDFTADSQGAAAVAASESWVFDEFEPPRSLVLHAGHTRTDPGKAGTAGARVACLTLGSR